MAAWRRSSSGSSFTAPCPRTVGASELSRLHCPRDPHIALCLSGRRSRPCPALGKRLAGDARQALGACFLTRCKFFLFKALASPRSPFPSPFVPRARAGCGGSPGGDPNALWVPRRGFPWSHARLGSPGKAAKPNSSRGLPLFFFFFSFWLNRSL